MRVLFLTHRLPYAPNRGDRVRAYHLLRGLAQRADVDLLSLVHDDEEDAHARDLDGVAASVTTVRVSRRRNLVRALAGLPGPRPLTHILLDAPNLSSTLARVSESRRPDLVLAYCSGMARLAFEPTLRSRPLVLDMVDVDSQKWRELGQGGTSPKSWMYRREAQRLGTFEASAMRRAIATLVVNEREAAVARRLAPDAAVHVVSNGIDVDSLRCPAGGARGGAHVVFCGVMNYEPNEQGVLWFLREVWPIVRAARPEARFTVVGANPTPRLRRACEGDQSVEITGSVPDVRPYLWRATISVAPLHLARGLQNKVLEAAAAGLPGVVTPNVFAGLPHCVAPACEVADGVQAFARSVLKLLDEGPAARQAMLTRADLGSISWRRSLEPLWALLRATANARLAPAI